MGKTDLGAGSWGCLVSLMLDLSIKKMLAQVQLEGDSCKEGSCCGVYGMSGCGWTLCECACPCCAYLLVYTHAYVWEQEADECVRTPNDSALHGQDSCFMSTGSHKLHGLAIPLLQHGAGLSLSPSLSLFFLNHSHTLSFFTHTLFTFFSCGRLCYFFLAH